MPTSSLKEQLLATDEEFRQWFEQHQAYEQQLEAIQQQTLPSQEDEIEMKRIKLHKLALKDRMEAKLVSRRQAMAAVSA